jgi:hypothetical protein
MLDFRSIVIGPVDVTVALLSPSDKSLTNAQTDGGVSQIVVLLKRLLYLYHGS